MVAALIQCASETLNTGEDASRAATRCIEMFRRLFPDITRDELRSALAGAEQRRSELNVLRWVEAPPQSVPAENTVSDGVPKRQPFPQFTAARLTGLILRYANRSGDLLSVAFLPFKSEVAEQFFEMLIFPPIPLLHVAFTVHCKVTELITSGRSLIKPVLMRLSPPACLSRQRMYAVFALINHGIRMAARLRRMTRFISDGGRVSST